MLIGVVERLQLPLSPDGEDEQAVSRQRLLVEQRVRTDKTASPPPILAFNATTVTHHAVFRTQHSARLVAPDDALPTSESPSDSNRMLWEYTYEHDNRGGAMLRAHGSERRVAGHGSHYEDTHHLISARYLFDHKRGHVHEATVIGAARLHVRGSNSVAESGSKSSARR